MRAISNAGAGALDKRKWEPPGTGLTPDKKEARSDRGTGNDVSVALAALARGHELQSNNQSSILNRNNNTYLAIH